MQCVKKMKRIDVVFKTWKNVEEDTRIWAKEIEKTYKPDLIIFIAKSGYLFAKTLYEYFQCEIIDVQVSRPTNKKADIIKKIFPVIPKQLLAFYLKFKVSRKNYSKNKTRKIILNTRFENCSFEKYQRILIVDDSVDTGWSLLMVTDLLDNMGLKNK